MFKMEDHKQVIYMDHDPKAYLSILNRLAMISKNLLWV